MNQGWVTKKMGDVLTIERGGSPRPIEKYITDSPDGLNWIKISDATASDKYIYETKQKITKDGLHKTRLVTEGDFILSNSMSFGRPYILKTTGCIHDGWLVLKQNGNKIFDTEFLYYLLSSPFVFNQFNSKAAGSTVRNLNIALVSSVMVPIPPLSEQQRIVTILDEAFAAIDKAKANAEQNLKNAKELFDSYLQGVFENKGEGWEEKKLGEVCNIIGGGTPSKGNNDFYGGNIPWATVRDMKNDLIKDTEHKITIEAVKNSSTNIIPKGNVIIATRVGLGKVCLLQNDTAINQDLRGVVPINAQKVSIGFLFRWFKTIAPQIIEEGTGATVQGVKLPFIKSLVISIPPIKVQEELVLKMNELSVEIKALETVYQVKLKDLEELKKSLLQKAFAGELNTEKAIAI